MAASSLADRADVLVLSYAATEEQANTVKDMPRQRLAELVAKECGKELGKSRGWTERTVLLHIQSYLEEH